MIVQISNGVVNNWLARRAQLGVLLIKVRADGLESLEIHLLDQDEWSTYVQALLQLCQPLPILPIQKVQAYSRTLGGLQKGTSRWTVLRT